MSIMKSTAVALLALALACSALAQGPFGFERGMTREQVAQLVGGKPGTKNSDVVWRTDKSPIPNNHFEGFTLFISPTQGLLKIIAVGKDIETSDTGAELKSEFEAIHAGVNAKYGDGKNYDACNGGTGCSSPSVWMLGLMEKNATLASFWSPSGKPNHINLISLEARALRLNKGFCNLVYEFEGWEAFVDAMTAKQNQSF